MAIEFFGKVDRNRRGEIASQMPAWYFDSFIEEMEENINRKERMLEQGNVPKNSIAAVREELKQEKQRLKEIKESKPQLSDTEKDTIAKTYKNIEEQIKDTLPTRSEELLGLVSPREELKKNKTPCIKINPSIAKACGVKSYQGKVTRDDAVRCYKMIGKLLDDNTNIERLRRDAKHGTYRSMDELTQFIMDKIKGAKV